MVICLCPHFEWMGKTLINEKEIDIVVLDMPLLNTTIYKDLNGIETLISDLILQLLSYMAEDEKKESVNDKEKGLQLHFKKELNLEAKKLKLMLTL